MLTDGEAAEDCIWEQVLLADELPSDDLDFDVEVQLPEEECDVSFLEVDDHA